jgi:hypothetical protein
VSILPKAVALDEVKQQPRNDWKLNRLMGNCLIT